MNESELVAAKRIFKRIVETIPCFDQQGSKLAAFEEITRLCSMTRVRSVKTWLLVIGLLLILNDLQGRCRNRIYLSCVGGKE